MAASRYEYRCDNCGGATDTALSVLQDGGTVVWCFRCVSMRMQSRLPNEEPQAVTEAPKLLEAPNET